jgi:hypothetical protein
MRPHVLLLCLGLAGCATASATQDVTGSTAPSGAKIVHSTLPSGAQAAQASGGKGEWWREGGVTREKVSAMCWMKYEQGRKDMPIDKRADLVNACVTETMKQESLF